MIERGRCRLAKNTVVHEDRYPALITGISRG